VSTLHQMVDILRQELEAARERERDYRERIAWLQHQIEQTQQRYDRLLDVGRGGAPAGPPEAPRYPSAAEARGAMRQRILALLREHSAGLSGNTSEARKTWGPP
jgi:hypothetical protein